MANEKVTKKKSWRQEEYADDAATAPVADIPTVSAPRVSEPLAYDERDPWSIAAICHRRQWPLPAQRAKGSAFSLEMLVRLEREAMHSHGLAVDQARLLDLCQYLRHWAGHPRGNYDA